MAMTWIWTGMVVLSLVFGLFTGNLDAVADAAMDGAASAVELSVSMAGILCLWSGVMEIMNVCGLSAGLARAFRPILRRLMPQASRDEKTLAALSANVSANLLGLGNAATPLGIQAALLHAGRAHFVGQLAEQFAEHPVVGRGNGEASPGRIEAHAAQFVGGVGQSGIEIAQQAVNGMYGNLPDAEEAEDMVDAESVEIFGHLRHAGLPPRIAVLRHVLPVIGREAPVLPRCGKGVGRRSGLPVEMEEVRILPHVGARRTDADRNIAFEDDAPLPSLNWLCR